MAKPKSTAPEQLDKPEAELFSRIQSEYAITDAAGVALLTLACESSMCVRHCRERVAKDGLMTDQGRSHPLLAVMRDAKNSFLACIRQLGLDTESAGAVGAPIGNTNSMKRVK